MSTLVGVLWFVIFVVVATVAVLAATLAGVVLAALGLLISPVLALALALLLLLRPGRPARTETRPGVMDEGQGPLPMGHAAEPSPPSAEAPAAAVKRAA